MKIKVIAVFDVDVSKLHRNSNADSNLEIHKQLRGCTGDGLILDWYFPTSEKNAGKIKSLGFGQEYTELQLQYEKVGKEKREIK